MTASLNDVEAAALQLSDEERAELIERLIDSMPPPPPLDPSWEGEIARRVAEMDEGREQSIPGEKVIAELRAMREPHPLKR